MDFNNHPGTFDAIESKIFNVIILFVDDTDETSHWENGLTYEFVVIRMRILLKLVIFTHTYKVMAVGGHFGELLSYLILNTLRY